DHFLGWLPDSDGRQAGLSYKDLTGKRHATYALDRNATGCGNSDPDHSWEGGLIQLNRGRCDGWLRTPKERAPGDTFPIGYFEQGSVPVRAALARSYTTL